MTLTNPDWFVSMLAILTGILGVARLTRIVVYDDFPPAIWLRMTVERLLDRGPYARAWSKIVTCWWCLAPWLALVCILWWMFLVPLHPAWLYAWWAWWGMLAGGYVATMVIVRDTPKE